MLAFSIQPILDRSRSSRKSGLATALFRNGFDHGLNVAIGERPAPMTPLGVLVSVRNVIIDEEAVVAVVEVSLHRSVHIDMTRVDELLVEVLRIRRRNVAEMDVQNFFLLHHFCNEFVESVTL